MSRSIAAPSAVLALGAVVLAVVLAWPGGESASGRRPSTSGDPTAPPAVDLERDPTVRKAMRLARDEPHHDPVSLSPAYARSLAARRQRSIPLPRGGNFNGIRWPGGSGGVPAEQFEAVLEFNAMCQWLRAQGEGRQSHVATRVLDEARRWPSLRGMGAVTPSTVVGCYASHGREAVEAARRGLEPSS